jgi:hypothetical protein
VPEAEAMNDAFIEDEPIIPPISAAEKSKTQAKPNTLHVVRQNGSCAKPRIRLYEEIRIQQSNRQNQKSSSESL